MREASRDKATQLEEGGRKDNLDRRQPSFGTVRGVAIRSDCLDALDRALAHSLNDACWQPMHMLIDRLPWDGMPVCRGVGDSTSREFRRHLQRPLHRFLKVSRSSTPPGSLPACALGDVATHIRPATGRRSLFPTPIPASPLVGLTVFLPSFRKERYGLTTFHKIDKDG